MQRKVFEPHSVPRSTAEPGPLSFKLLVRGKLIYRKHVLGGVMRRLAIGREVGFPHAADLDSLRAGLSGAVSSDDIVETRLAWVCCGRPVHVCEAALELERLIELRADLRSVCDYLAVLRLRPLRNRRVRERFVRPIADDASGLVQFSHLAVRQATFRRPLAHLPLTLALDGLPIVLETWFDADNRLIAFEFKQRGGGRR